MALLQGFVILSDEDTDAPAAPSVATVSTLDRAWDSGGFGMGAAAAAAGRCWVDRPFFTGNPTVDWLVDRVNRSTASGAVVQLGNELNLPLEGWVGGPEEWFALEDAVRARVAEPDRVIAMPPSPGLPEWQSWVRRAGDHAVHAYGRLDQLRAIVAWFLEATDGALYLTEINFGSGQSVDRDEWANRHLLPFLDWCSSFDRVRVAQYFAYRWRRPDTALPTPIDAAGTAIESVIRDWRPTIAPGPTPEPAPNPWAGKLLTVWNLPADPTELVSWAEALDLDGFEVKTADGDSSWLDAPRRHLTRAYVDQLRAGGRYRVAGWSYNYCDLVTGDAGRGDGVPEAEAAAAARGVDALGLDGHTFDLEIECEGHADLVAILLRTGRELIGVPLAAHTWASYRGHADYPWGVIADGVDVLRPMIYRPSWTARQCWAELGDWLEGRVVCPELSITESAATPETLEADAGYALEQGAAGFGFWERAGLPGELGVAEWIAGLEVPSGGEQPLPGPDPAAELADLQARTWAQLDDLQSTAAEWSALGWPSTASGIGAAAEAAKSLVRSSKLEK